MTGNMTWTKADGTVIHYDIQGNKVVILHQLDCLAGDTVPRDLSSGQTLYHRLPVAPLYALDYLRPIFQHFPCVFVYRRIRPAGRQINVITACFPQDAAFGFVAAEFVRRRQRVRVCAPFSDCLNPLNVRSALWKFFGEENDVVLIVVFPNDWRSFG